MWDFEQVYSISIYKEHVLLKLCVTYLRVHSIFYVFICRSSKKQYYVLVIKYIIF